MCGGYINQVPISTDLDGSIFNSKGYLEEKRLNSAGNVVDLEYTGQGCNPVVTGFIPVKNNDTFYFKNAYLLKANEYALRIMTYDDNKKIVASELNNLTGNALVTGSYSSRINFELEEVGMDTLAVTKLKAPENWETGGIPAYIRFTLQRPSADAVPIITINEEID